MSETLPDKAECRGCGMELKGTPYYQGRPAYHPKTGNQCNVSFWGGFICSDNCDRITDARMKTSIDNHNDPSGYYRRK